MLVQCGCDEDEYIPEMCVCGGTLPWICWISECINGTWSGAVKHNPRLVLQSRIWVLLGVAPALCGAWLLSRHRRCMDWALAAFSSVYLLIGLLPDTLAGSGSTAHTSVAFVGLVGALCSQLCFPWHALAVSLSIYMVSYVALSEVLVADGAPRRWVYDWSFTQGTEPSSLVPVVLEWVGAFGAAGVAITYCASEDLRQLRDRVAAEQVTVSAEADGAAAVALPSPRDDALHGAADEDLESLDTGSRSELPMVQYDANSLRPGSAPQVG